MVRKYNRNNISHKSHDNIRVMKLSDFDYQLPEHLIAHYPPERRGDSRLLCLDGNSGAIVDRHFAALQDLVKAGDLLVFNNTQVIPARVHGQKASGGKVEILVERIVEDHLVLAMVRSSKSPKPGSVITLEGDIAIGVEGRQEQFFLLRCQSERWLDLLNRTGHMPLPPYIDRQDEIADLERYQTVYAKHPGAVAAPTAGLHFTNEMISTLKQQGVNTTEVTLHVGAGTFQPVRVENLDEHIMHKEYVEVSTATVEQINQTRQAGGRVIAVGTTSVRSLESAAHNGNLQPFYDDTQLFIRPGYQFQVVDVLITNFHLPQSTLMMLVSAFAGYDNIRQAYRHAVEQQYRFFSYGDAMWLTRRDIG